jgi:hypothetical protein
MRNKPNARFWTVVNNGLVKLTLRYGHPIIHARVQNTDEGWNMDANTWIHYGKHIEVLWVSDGRDCDGRMTNSGISRSSLEDLKAGHVNDEGIKFPIWHSIENNQRDYEAEKMGY